ncbi:unnamed protein product [Rangifer tarandus platyrhynchus]|uniref:Uncharacterized protein n=1 Tax=Rangifer tarandus platyrhynchus TaxID=3082113 RepID=A0AC59Y5S2_RANTA
MMSTSGNSSSHPVSFILLGIPGLENSQFWVAFPFCAMYVVVLVGNITLLHVIRTDPTLHEPMYLFLAMLATTDLVLSTSTQPKMLAIFWFHDHEIEYHACLIQLFFIHAFSSSSVLLAMAFDRYIAICNPLRYATILTNSRIIKVGFAIVVRVTTVVRLNFCPGKILLSHSFCFHADVMKRACADITVNIIYGLYVVLSTMGIDSLLIVLSYTLILHTVMSLASPRERIRALNTCVSHILAVLVFFIPVIGVSMIHRFGRHLPPIVHALVAYVYLVVPPVLNPIIYSVKSKPIRKAMLRVLREKRKG